MVKSIKALGHEPLLVTNPTAQAGDAAILNLSSPHLSTPVLVSNLRELGVYVIGHAGHKERDLLELGRLAGCNRLATNSELTFKLENLLDEALNIAPDGARNP